MPDSKYWEEKQKRENSAYNKRIALSSASMIVAQAVRTGMSIGEAVKSAKGMAKELFEWLEEDGR